MRKRRICVLCALALLFCLSACGEEPAAFPPARSPAPAAAPEPTPARLTETEVRALCEEEGYYTVLDVTPYGEDYLVELTERGGPDHFTARPGDGRWRAVYWVFGNTGYKVWMNREFSMEELDSWRVVSPGVVEFVTTGRNTEVPGKRTGCTYTVSLTVDSGGRLLPDYEGMGLETAVAGGRPHGGWQALDEPIPANGNPVFMTAASPAVSSRSTTRA